MVGITVSDIAVEFPVLDDRSRSLRHALVLDKISKTLTTIGAVGGVVTRAASGVRIVRALEGLSFALEPGDRLGLLGHNGSGKTTLLRVLSGVFEPAVGAVDIRGSVMSLMNIDEGIAPDATGLEAIRIRGHLLGLSNRHIEELTQDVIDFCELGEFIDLPVRTYSTGMKIRLAFAIATAMTSDILLMDEVIGAGDAAFIERAEARLKEFVERASIMVVATHSDGIIRQWCNKAMVLERGRLAFLGGIEGALEYYHTKSRP